MRAAGVLVVVVFVASSGLVGFKMLREIADFDEWWADRQADIADLPDPAGAGERASERGEAC